MTAAGSEAAYFNNYVMDRRRPLFLSPTARATAGESSGGKIGGSVTSAGGMDSAASGVTGGTVTQDGSASTNVTMPPVTNGNNSAALS